MSLLNKTELKNKISVKELTKYYSNLTQTLN